jgi:hypothetical protein
MTLFAAASSLIVAGLMPNLAAETAVFFSALLATGNALCALLLSHIGGTRRSTKAFFGAVLGGMLFRMTATLAGFWFGLKILLLPAVTFAVALLAYTGLFIAAEVSLWSRQDFSRRVQAS